MDIGQAGTTSTMALKSSENSFAVPVTLKPALIIRCEHTSVGKVHSQMSYKQSFIFLAFRSPDTGSCQASKRPFVRCSWCSSDGSVQSCQPDLFRPSSSYFCLVSLPCLASPTLNANSATILHPVQHMSRCHLSTPFVDNCHPKLQL